MSAQKTVSADDGHHTERDHRVVLEHLERWEANRLVTASEAEAIRTFERTEAGPQRRVPLVTEALGYLGAALALAAGGVLVGQRWTDLARGSRLAIPIAAALILFVAGWLLRRSEEPAIQRFTGVLWTLSVAGVAGTLAEWLYDLPANQDPRMWSLFVVGVVTALYAWLLLAIRPTVPLQAALFVGSLLTSGGAGLWARDAGWTWLKHVEPSWFGVAMAVVSGLWIWAAMTDAVGPRRTGVAIGTFGALYAGTFAMVPSTGFGMMMGVLVAVALVALAVAIRDIVVLALAAVGLFMYLVGAIIYYLRDTLGVPLALFLSGVVLVAIAVGTARLKRFTESAER